MEYELIVTPVNVDEPGSYGIFRRLTQAVASMKDAQEEGDFLTIARGINDLDDLLKAHVTVSGYEVKTEGLTEEEIAKAEAEAAAVAVAVALDALSIPEFYELLNTILGSGSGDSVPTESADD